MLSAEYNPDEFYMQSTNVNRTMQSGYSELMGLYPPGSGDTLTHAMQDSVNLGGPALPPFKVRDLAEINDQLGEDALPGRPIAVPIFVFNNDDIHDDASYDGCPFIEDVESARINDDEVFAPFDWMMDGARGPIQEMYNLTDDYMDSLNFHHFETLTDEAVAVDFEGWPEHSTFFSDE